MTDFSETPSGVTLPVRATAGARRDELRGWQAGRLKVAVRQVAEQGKANRAIADLLAERLALRRSQIRLLSGATSSQKVFLVQEISLADLSGRIDRALMGP